MFDEAKLKSMALVEPELALKWVSSPVLRSVISSCCSS